MKVNKIRTRAEWHEAADLAEFWLHVDAARQYGLIAGGPKINVAHCQRLLRAAARQGITPSPGCVERLTRAIAGAPCRA